MSEFLNLYENPNGLAAREGSSDALTITAFDPASPDDPQDLTGWAINFVLKQPNQDYDGQDAPSTYVVRQRQDVLGTFQLFLSNTHQLTEGLYPYTLEISNNDVRRTLMTGQLEVLARIDD